MDEVAMVAMRVRLSRARQALRRFMDESAQAHGVPESVTRDLDAWARRMRAAVAEPDED